MKVFFVAAVTAIIIPLTWAKSGIFANSIDECPPLQPRSVPAKSVHDLRIDDIKVIGALGDSVTAGFRILGYNKSSNAPIVDYLEYRGLSYTVGGAKGAPTVPNYIKHYQPNLIGYSNGVHLFEKCFFGDCVAPYQPQMDQLNAAQSGAGSKHLDREVNYLIQTMKNITGIDFENDWKMINIQIGSNDVCHTCNNPFVADTTVEKYGAFVDAAIDKIRANIPKVFVNLIAAFHVDPPYAKELSDSYCNPNRIQLCPCLDQEGSLPGMNKIVEGYNSKLQGIYQKHLNNPSDSFALAFQHANFALPFPIEMYSNVDCRHPGLSGQKWLSLVLWDQLFTPQVEKPSLDTFSVNRRIYCPSETDRLLVQ